MHKLKEKIYNEIKALEEKPMTEKSLEYIYKLVDIYKDIKEIEEDNHTGDAHNAIPEDDKVAKISHHYGEYHKTKNLTCLDNMLKNIVEMLQRLTSEEERKIINNHFGMIR